MREDLKTPEVIKEIVGVTSKIRVHYPELHKELIDSAALFHDGEKDEINTRDLEKHLEKLKVLLNKQKQRHINNYYERTFVRV